MSYYDDQIALQVAFRESGGFSPGSEEHGLFQGKPRPFVFTDEHWPENLFAEQTTGETTRAGMLGYFESFGWHRAHRHLLSSQVCCVNFLAPFRNKPQALAALLTPLYPGQSLKPLKLLSEDSYIAFEWIGETDYLNEQEGDRPRTRGANCTSVDAAVLLDVDGSRQLLLIEWKYTERYGPRLSGGERARRVRDRRYADLAFAPHGPLKTNHDLWLTDFFYEPFYQLLRQQMLATQLERHHVYGCKRARVLHISPDANVEVTRVTSPELRRRFKEANAFDLWKGLLADPSAFNKISRDGLFGSFDAEANGMQDWRAYIERRYGV